jgi:hypothetical protein
MREKTLKSPQLFREEYNMDSQKHSLGFGLASRIFLRVLLVGIAARYC